MIEGRLIQKILQIHSSIHSFIHSFIVFVVFLFSSIHHPPVHTNYRKGDYLKKIKIHSSIHPFYSHSFHSLFDLSHPFFLHQSHKQLKWNYFRSFFIHPYIHSSLRSVAFLICSSSTCRRDYRKETLFFLKQIFIHPVNPFHSSIYSIPFTHSIHSIHFIRCFCPFSSLLPSPVGFLREEELRQGRPVTTETQQRRAELGCRPLSARLLCSSTTTTSTVHDPMSFSRTSQSHAFHALLFLHGSSSFSSSSASVLHSLRLNCFFSSSSYLAAHFTNPLHP